LWLENSRNHQEIHTKGTKEIFLCSSDQSFVPVVVKNNYACSIAMRVCFFLAILPMQTGGKQNKEKKGLCCIPDSPDFHFS
jgi:hypothetical protein